MDISLLLLVFGLFWITVPGNVSGVWWVVGNTEVICRRKTHRAICRKQPELIREVALGARMGLRECQEQFSHRRWNCTRTRRSIGKILKKDTREAAFVWAISAAGAMYSVTKACTRGSLRNCGCEPIRIRTHQTAKNVYTGCHDNVTYAYQASRDFMDPRRSRRRRSDVTTRIRQHNNEAGRLAVEQAMGVNCKCHGLSGSCNMKTCFKQLKPFHVIGARLKELFDGATKVRPSNVYGSSLVPVGEVKQHNHTDLIYAEESPNFCKRNRRVGSLGTSGRLCNVTSADMDGCDILCCGRGYRKMTFEVEENCKCRFVTKRFTVECEKCRVVKTEYRCV